MEKFLIFHISVIFCITFSHSKSFLPLGHVKCRLNDSECLTIQAQNTLQTFVEGIPKLEDEKTDVIDIESVAVENDGFFYNWTNIKAEGLKNTIINNVSINMDLKTMRVSFEANLYLNVDYVAGGTYMTLFPLYGNGKGKITLRKMRLQILFIFDINKNDDGKKYMDLKRYYQGFSTIDSSRLEFDDLYNGDEEKSKAAMKFVNENSDVGMVTYGGYFTRKLTDKIFKAVKTYMHSYPLDDLALLN